MGHTGASRNSPNGGHWKALRHFPQSPDQIRIYEKIRFTTPVVISDPVCQRPGGTTHQIANVTLENHGKHNQQIIIVKITPQLLKTHVFLLAKGPESQRVSCKPMTSNLPEPFTQFCGQASRWICGCPVTVWGGPGKPITLLTPPHAQRVIWLAR